ncbi:MAG TPA: sigma-70 family RNA polymerase sigma factor [Acidimicrobiales bacterium]|nr:sigma-70 family RNA polymerase sigma factor [Acidimicrobiales bacterium]
MEQRRQGRWAEGVLVERLAGGDDAALADLYDRYAGFVYGLANRMLMNRQAAEDVTQEVFVALWENPARFEPGRGTLRGFLGTMTHRRAVDLIRREDARRRRESRAPADAAPAQDLAETAARTDTSGRVRNALALLPEAQRRALELAYFQGHTYRQVADVLGIPEGTAKSRLRLGLQRVAEILRPELSDRWA